MRRDARIISFVGMFTLACALSTLFGPAARGQEQEEPEESGVAGAPVPEEEDKFSDEELDALVGPIALYPDPLIAQVLPASTYPLEVVQAARYLKENEGKGNGEGQGRGQGQGQGKGF